MDSNILISDLIQGERWSFSKLNSFHTCKYMWYLTYIQKVDRLNLFFGLYGSFGHKIFEMYDKGELELFEMAQYYKDNYYEFIEVKAPYNKYVDLDVKYYDLGLTYFENFDGHTDKTVEAEKKVEFYIDVLDEKYPFVGYIDRVSQEGDDIIITDYKSKSKFKNKKEKEEYLRQLYLYSIPIKEEFGKYPKELNFNMYKEGLWVSEEFDESKIDDVKMWVHTTIQEIYNEQEFPANPSKYFCDNICSCGKVCNHSYNFEK